MGTGCRLRTRSLLFDPRSARDDRSGGHRTRTRREPGGLAGALWQSTTERFRSRSERAFVNIAGVSFVSAALIAVEAVETTLVGAAIVNVVLVFGIIGLPSLTGRLELFEAATPTD